MHRHLCRGRGDDGRLGHGDNGWKYVPRLTHSLTGQIITRVTCGSYHTAAVSSNGDLYVSYIVCSFSVLRRDVLIKMMLSFCRLGVVECMAN